jgi:hypothetical protein
LDTKNKILIFGNIRERYFVGKQGAGINLVRFLNM